MLNFLPGTLLGRGRPDFTQPPLLLPLQKVCNHDEVISAQIPWAFECVRKLLECSLLFMLIAKAFRLTNCSQILSMLTPFSLPLHLYLPLTSFIFCLLLFYVHEILVFFGLFRMQTATGFDGKKSKVSSWGTWRHQLSLLCSSSSSSS